MHSRTHAMLSRMEEECPSIAVFSTSLGWIALVTRASKLKRLSFGHRSAKSATEAIKPEVGEGATTIDLWTGDLVRRLTEYAGGAFDDFSDIKVETAHLSRFAASVIEAARRIPFGETCSYGELAASAGRARAARAVGRVMAQNRTPLVVPCHRVVASGGHLGGFSAPEGLRMKQRLLDLEARAAFSVR